MTDSLFQTAFAAAKAGNKPEAIRLFSQLVRQDSKNVDAWIWLSDLLDDPQRKKDCLNWVLKLEPTNAAAQARLTKLQPPAPAPQPPPLPPVQPAPPPVSSQPLTNQGYANTAAYQSQSSPTFSSNQPFPQPSTGPARNVPAPQPPPHIKQAASPAKAPAGKSRLGLTIVILLVLIPVLVFSTIGVLSLLGKNGPESTSVAGSSGGTTPQPAKVKTTQAPAVVSVVPDKPSTTPSPTLIPSPTPTLEPPPVFSDNFENGLADGWYGKLTNFSTINGRLVTTYSLGTLLFLGNSTWNNYSLDLDVIIDETVNEQDLYSEFFTGFSTYFGIKGINEYNTVDAGYLFSLSKTYTNDDKALWRDVVKTFNITNSRSNDVNTSEFDRQHLIWGLGSNHIRLEVRGNMAKFFVNGQSITTFGATEQLNGAIAISFDKNYMSVDNVLVQPLP